MSVSPPSSKGLTWWMSTQVDRAVAPGVGAAAVADQDRPPLLG